MAGDGRISRVAALTLDQFHAAVAPRGMITLDRVRFNQW